MIVVPAIDLRGGKVVRLKQGQLQEETVYGSDPAEAARRWEEEGAQRLHVVDLDAAISGKPQFDAIAAIIDAVKIPVEVGGGLRVLENAMRYRERGADRVIFGTAAVADPGVVQEAARLWPEAVAVALDARDGKVAVAGWKEITTVDAARPGGAVKAWGVRAHPVHGRAARRHARRARTWPASSSMAARGRPARHRRAAASPSWTTSRRLRALEPLGVDEVIVGKALYEQRFTLAEAQAEAARLMLAKRLVPCLDVDRGRVVKGVKLRVPARRRRSRGVRGPLRRGGRGRARVPRHHRLLRRAAHRARHGAPRGRHRVPALHGGRRRALGGGRRRAAARGRGQGGGQHGGGARSRA